jgi:hypothetical protein
MEKLKKREMVGIKFPMQKSFNFLGNYALLWAEGVVEKSC